MTSLTQIAYGSDVRATAGRLSRAKWRATARANDRGARDRSDGGRARDVGRSMPRFAAPLVIDDSRFSMIASTIESASSGSILRGVKASAFDETVGR